MKRTVFAIIALAIVCCTLGGCLTLKPFTQDELDRLSSLTAYVQAG
jgi:hypothetical protein